MACNNLTSYLERLLDQRRLSIAFALAIAAPAAIFFNAPAEAGNCTVVRAVPWAWTLKQAIGGGKNKTNPLTVYNDGGIGFVKPGVSQLLGDITIGAIHDPGNACGRIDPLPNQANIRIDWIISGNYTNNTFKTNPAGLDFETFIKVIADGLSFVPANPPLTQVDESGLSAGLLLKSRPAIIGLGLGVHPYTGSLNVETKYGFGAANFNGVKDAPDINIIQVDPFLEFTAVLANPVNVPIRYLYPEPVPAPLPMLGVGIALGYARRLRKMSRQMRAIRNR
jgi:hypothetical protein